MSEADIPRSPATKRRKSATRISVYSGGSSGRKPMLDRTAVGLIPMSTPSMVTVPKKAAGVLPGPSAWRLLPHR